MKKGLWLRAGTAVLLLATSTQAWAQSTPPADREEGQDDEIVVTAQKRSERLIEVPQSITAVSSDDLARLNATQFRDFANTVPALSFTSSGAGQSQVSLRGVTAGLDIGQTVGIYVDDVPYGSSSAFTKAPSIGLDVGLFDLDRIEVLRGPQGTLYGASAMGGVLKYITRQPSLVDFGGDAQAGVSATEHGGVSYNGALAVDIPIVSEKAGVRASGFYSRDGGFVRNVATGEDDVGRSRIYGGRLDFLFQPTDALSVRLVGFTQDIHRDGTPAVDFTMTGRPVDGDLDQRRTKPEPFDQRFRLVSGTIGYEFSFATLTSISSYQTTDTHYRQDISALYVPLLAGAGLNFSSVNLDQELSTDKFTQEVRLISTGKGSIEWLVGGFYTKEKSGNRQELVSFDPSGALSPLNLLTVSLPSKYKEIAGFGNLTVHLSDAFDVTGGVRYARNNQSYTQNGSGIFIGSAPTSTASDDVVTYLANARYRFSPHATAYARFATGYRPGGPNFVVRDANGVLLAPTSFQPDTLNSYEVGFKGETADRTFGIDVAGYRIDWDNMQVASAAGNLSVIANAKRARVDGAELTLTARPSRSFTATGAFAYQNARLTEDAVELGGAAGDPLPNVPKFTAAVSADYRAIDSHLQPSLGGTLRFVSDRVASFDASALIPQYDLGDYVTIDLRAGAVFGSVKAQVFVRNLLDERGQLSAATMTSLAGGPAQVTIVQPRTFGITLTTNF